MKNVLGKMAKVIAHDTDADSGYSINRRYVNKHLGKIGKIVDYSDSHGECYGLIFKKTGDYSKVDVNNDGFYGRENNPPDVLWFEPNEIKIMS